MFRFVPLLVLLAGCAGTPTVPTPGKGPGPAYQALQAGDYHAAARQFLELAAKATGPARDEYRLQAVQALLQGGMEDQAAALLDQINPAGMPPATAMERQLLAAELSLPEDPDRALQLLKTPADLQGSPDRLARYYHLRAQAFEQLGNYLEAAREYIQRELYLSDPKTVEANQYSTWDALSHLSNDALRQLRLNPPPDVLSGWMELMEIAKEMDKSPDHIASRISEWQRRYPTHPVLPSFLRSIEEQSRDLMVRPHQIGVLLPFTGRFSSAAAAIRDGLLAAYYRDPQHADTELRFYDEGNPATVLTQYQQAVADGAGFIIGPLDKDAVRVLASQSELAVPTLALNDADPPQNSSLYEFGLSPEDEARQVAELAWLDGRNHAAVLVPQGPWGERLNSAFSQRWAALGGSVVSSATYDPQQSDFETPLRALLNLDQSRARRSELQDLLRRSLEFQPHRRQDIDFVFMAGFPQQARLLRPQLRFHRAIGIPIYSTSHVFSGTVDAAKDRDMDGVIFGDMPWTLNTETPYAAIHREDAPLLASHAGSLQRLVAMGVDAYHLVTRLKMLASYPSDRFSGETGTLRVDKNGRVLRHLEWARFVQGEPKPLNRTLPLEQPTQAPGGE